MRIGWVGVHAEGISALKAVCGAEYDVTGLITLRRDKADKRCGSADYELICQRYDIPYHEVDNINDVDSIDLLQSFRCDVLVVLGWGQILGPEALRQATIGVVGAHASLLPRNRGSAPVNWAIINGEHETGNSLIWLEEGVDAGQLIDQRSFPITSYDSCTTVYDKVAESNLQMMLNLLRQLEAGERPGRPQQEPHEAVLPRRRPQDGVIDWNSSSEEIYNLVRALTRPYPGAFAYLNDQPFRIWSAARTPINQPIAAAGTVIGPVHSPEPKACGQMIATADGAVLILEVEDSSGNLLQGPELSEQDWIGRRLSNAA